MSKPCSICDGQGCLRCVDSGKETARIIKDFLAVNPQFKGAEWNAEYDDLTVWFNKGYVEDPEEPFCIDEFMKFSPTWLLLEKLIGDLEECDREDCDDQDSEGLVC